jgi:hypothetical protein
VRPNTTNVSIKDFSKFMFISSKDMEALET